MRWAITACVLAFLAGFAWELHKTSPAPSNETVANTVGITPTVRVTNTGYITVAIYEYRGPPVIGPVARWPTLKKNAFKRRHGRLLKRVGKYQTECIPIFNHGGITFLVVGLGNDPFFLTAEQDINPVGNPYWEWELTGSAIADHNNMMPVEVGCE